MHVAFVLTAAVWLCCRTFWLVVGRSPWPGFFLLFLLVVPVSGSTLTITNLTSYGTLYYEPYDAGGVLLIPDAYESLDIGPGSSMVVTTDRQISSLAIYWAGYGGWEWYGDRALGEGLGFVYFASGEFVTGATWFSIISDPTMFISGVGTAPVSGSDTNALTLAQLDAELDSHAVDFWTGFLAFFGVFGFAWGFIYVKRILWAGSSGGMHAE